MMLAATTILSQFFRASTSVIAPELIRDLSLSPEALGFASGSFFLALLLPQIFVGVLFDRIGPRITVSALSVLMVAGALLHSVAEFGNRSCHCSLRRGAGLRGQLHVGGGAHLALVSQAVLEYGAELGIRAQPDRVSSCRIATGHCQRMARLAHGLRGHGGGRGSRGTAVLSLVRDHPPGPRLEEPQEELGAIAGLRRVLATPGLLRVLALFLVAYAAFAYGHARMGRPLPARRAWA